MSVKFTADGDYIYQAQINAPFTLAFWLRWNGLGGYNAQVMAYRTASEDLKLFYDPDVGPCMQGSHALAQVFAGTPTTDAWYYVVFQYVSAGNTKWGFIPSASSVSLVSGEEYGTYDGTYPLILASDTGDHLNGSIANVKMWTAILTTGQLDTEKASKAVVRTADLYCDTPLDVYTDLEDKFSTHDWTAAGTLATDASDPPWTAGAVVRNPVPMDFGLS